MVLFWGDELTLDSGAFGVIGGGVQRHRRAPLPGVVEAVVPPRRPREVGVAEQDHEAAEEAEGGAHPAGVQREAKGHEPLVLVGADGEPDGGDDAEHS